MARSEKKQAKFEEILNDLRLKLINPIASVNEKRRGIESMLRKIYDHLGSERGAREEDFLTYQERNALEIADGEFRYALELLKHNLDEVKTWELLKGDRDCYERLKTILIKQANERMLKYWQELMDKLGLKVIEVELTMEIGVKSGKCRRMQRWRRRQIKQRKKR